MRCGRPSISDVNGDAWGPSDAGSTTAGRPCFKGGSRPQPPASDLGSLERSAGLTEQLSSQQASHRADREGCQFRRAKQCPASPRPARSDQQERYEGLCIASKFLSHRASLGRVTTSNAVVPATVPARAVLIGPRQGQVWQSLGTGSMHETGVAAKNTRARGPCWRPPCCCTPRLVAARIVAAAEQREEAVRFADADFR